MPMVNSNMMAPGTAAPAFSLPGADGREWSLVDFEGAKALVVIFTCNHCPVAVATEDRFVEIQRDYEEKGVRLVAINPNDVARYPDDSLEHMKTRAAEKGFNFPYLRDDSQAVTRAYDAACTPDIFLFDEDQRLVYNGRIDDNWKDPNQVERQDLRLAIDAVLAGSPLPFEAIPSIGCSVKWVSP